MTLEVALDGVAVSASNILVGGDKSIQSLPAAADGSGSAGGILFDDPDGDLSVTGWQVVQVTEDDCVSAPTLFWGFIGERTEQKGPYRDPLGRQIDTSIIDSNTMLVARIVTGGDANRPSETQADRIAWLLGTDAVVPMFSDLGFVNGSTQVLDAANYRGMYPAEVLNDICTARAEIFFLYWDQTAESVGLFFDRPTATTFTCSLTVSNVMSDVDDSTCFAPMVDGTLNWNPEDVYSTGSMKYTGGTEYAIYPPTYAYFDAPSPILTRSFRVENDHVGKASTAHALLVQMLQADSTERETLRFTVRLPSTKVGLIQSGMRISCRFSHLTSFRSFAYTRIERLVIVPVDDQPTFYDVTVECSMHGISTAGSGTGGGSTDPAPYVPPVSTGPCGDGTTQLTIVSGASTSAETIHITSGQYVYVLSISIDITFLGTSEWSLWLPRPSDSAVTPSFTVPEILKIVPAWPSDPTSVGTWTSPNLTGDAGMNVSFTSPVQEGHGVWRWIAPDWQDSFFQADETGDYHLRAGNAVGDDYFGEPGYTASICLIASDLAPADFVAPTTTPAQPPNSGNPVGPETPTPAPDGSTDTFTTSFAFQTGSLRVALNGSVLTNGVDFTETTSTTFTFTDPPPTGAEILVWYLAL